MNKVKSIQVTELVDRMCVLVQSWSVGVDLGVGDGAWRERKVDSSVGP